MGEAVSNFEWQVSSTCASVSKPKIRTGNSKLGVAMSLSFKKSMGGTVALILFGLLALTLGTHWLVLLVPAAALVWYGTFPAWRSGRN